MGVQWEHLFFFFSHLREMYLGTKRCLLCGFDIAGNNLHPGQLQLTHHEFSLLQQPTVPPSIVHFKEDILCSFSGSFFFILGHY